MNITGTKGYVQIEDDDGTIARFDGETCLGGFYAYADAVHWIRHKGGATDEDRLKLIYKATEYGKNNHIKVLFFDNNDKVMFETELGLKTEVYGSKDYFALMTVIILSMLFSSLLIALLDVASAAFHAVINTAIALISVPFLLYGVGVWRFRVIAEGEMITVQPGFWKKCRFHTAEITRIIRKTQKDIGWDTVLKVTIYIKNKHVTLKRSMDGVDDMDAFLLRHVDPEKIITKKRKS